MKKNILKITLGLVLATTLTFASGIMAFAATPAQETSIPKRFTPIAAQKDLAEKRFTPIKVSEEPGSELKDKFFLDQDSEGFCYQVGDEVEVKIDRGYFTVRCRITDRKDGGWFNGNMYYVVPVGELNDMQELFFEEGWIHESEIQTIDPQPVFKAILEVFKFVKGLL